MIVIFTIAEALTLLATDDEKGTAKVTSSVQYGLSGAAIAELLYKGKLAIDKKKIIVKDDSLTDISFFNTIIEEIKEAKAKKVEHWIRYFSSKKERLIDPLYLSLVEKGILKEEEKTNFLIFSRTVYPTLDERAEVEIRKQVNDVVLNGKERDGEVEILLSLIKASSLINEVFGKENKKEAKQFIKEIEKENELAKLISKAISNVESEDMATISTTVINN